MNESALDGLRAAARAAPDDQDLGLLLASRLLDAGHADEALAAAQRVLAAAPTSVRALRTAVAAARSAGRADVAAGYATLLAALGDTPADPTADAAPDTDPARAGVRADAEAVPAVMTPDMAAVPDDELVAELDGITLDTEADTDEPAITLYDVAGLEGVKRRLQASFLGPLRNPELRRAFGASLRGGLLLYGPPGCGKTFLARALAGELKARFLSFGITDVLDPWIGNTERNLHAQFELARRSVPCVLFLDEVDALGRKRSQMHSAGRTIVNQLLIELDSIGTDNSGLFVLAATNHPWDVDVALRRPGRFDRTVFVPPPDLPARERIFALHLQDRPVESVDYTALARRTEGYSGADIAHVCGTAAEAALERSVARGVVSAVTTADIDAALREVRPSTAAWFEMARNHVLYGNESGVYDELAEYLRLTDQL